MSDLVEIGALWITEGRDGKKYLGGKLGNNARLLVLRNDHKEPGSKQPDYRVLVAPDRRQQGEASGPVRETEEIPF